MASQDPELLRLAIKDFEKNDVPEKSGDITKAKKLLDYLIISQGEIYIDIKHIHIFSGMSRMGSN